MLNNSLKENIWPLEYVNMWTQDKIQPCAWNVISINKAFSDIWRHYETALIWNSNDATISNLLHVNSGMAIYPWMCIENIKEKQLLHLSEWFGVLQSLMPVGLVRGEKQDKPPSALYVVGFEYQRVCCELIKGLGRLECSRTHTVASLLVTIGWFVNIVPLWFNLLCALRQKLFPEGCRRGVLIYLLCIKSALAGERATIFSSTK